MAIFSQKPQYSVSYRPHQIPTSNFTISSRIQIKNQNYHSINYMQLHQMLQLDHQLQVKKMKCLWVPAVKQNSEEREVADYDYFTGLFLCRPSGQGEKHYFTGLFLCRPSGQGKSMLIVRFGTTKRSPLAKFFPAWYFHQNAGKVFEQDMGFLSSQNEVLITEKVPTKKLYLNLKSSDTWVAEYRKWMDKVGHGMPCHFGHSTISPPEVPALIVFNLRNISFGRFKWND